MLHLQYLDLFSHASVLVAKRSGSPSGDQDLRIQLIVIAMYKNRGVLLLTLIRGDVCPVETAPVK